MFLISIVSEISNASFLPLFTLLHRHHQLLGRVHKRAWFSKQLIPNTIWSITKILPSLSSINPASNPAPMFYLFGSDFQNFISVVNWDFIDSEDICQTSYHRQ